MTVNYLSLNGLAERVGIAPGTAKRYLDDRRLPEPDVSIGAGERPTYGWAPETVDAWQASRPGKGGRPRKNTQL